MKITALIALLLLLSAFGLAAQAPDGEEPAPGPKVRFMYVSVYVDSQARPLAAYQFELAAKTGDVRIAGVEGGEHRAFRKPPYYDLAALRTGRMIIAAFSTADALPKGKTRVARLMMRVAGDQEPTYDVRLRVAASPKGKRIPATISIQQGEAK